MKSRSWLIIWFTVSILLLFPLGAAVYSVDPFLHYHAPDLNRYYYPLDNQTSQNDGILRQFDYDTIITGSSMTMNFKTSELDAIWGTHSIKIPMAGGRFHDINEFIRHALERQPKLNTVIRSVDVEYLCDLYDGTDELPVYLYDNNLFNDISYLLNGDVIFDRVFRMRMDAKQGLVEPGITDFDSYSSFLPSYGRHALPFPKLQAEPASPVHLTEAELSALRTNISKNVIPLVQRYPDVDFYYFFTPYSILWWQEKVNEGLIWRELEAEQAAAEMLTEYDNVHLFSFQSRYDLITDLNNFGDITHYGYWINSLILRWMHDGKYQLTKENYSYILQQDFDFYSSFDYSSLLNQEDYEYDLVAAALVNQELTGAEPIIFSEGEILTEGEFPVSGGSGHGYLVFSAKKESGFGNPDVVALDVQNQPVAVFEAYSDDPGDDEWHQYAMSLNGTEPVAITLHSGENAEYLFCDITLY